MAALSAPDFRVLCIKMKNKVHQISTLLFILLLLFSCSRSYNGQYFSFPPGSKPHENNWTYLCKVISWDPVGKEPTDKGNRKIQIIIHDKEKNNLLRDEFELVSASINSRIKWENRKHLNLEIYERGNQFAEDDYNKQLIKEGPRHLITLSYVWVGNKYIKSDTEQVVTHSTGNPRFFSK